MEIYAIENHPNDSRAKVDPDGIVQTLSSRMGTGGNNTPFVLIKKQPCRFILNSSGCGIAAPLDASYYKGSGARAGIEREYVLLGEDEQVADENTFHVECMSHDLFSTKFALNGHCDTLARTDYKEPPVVAYVANIKAHPQEE